MNRISLKDSITLLFIIAALILPTTWVLYGSLLPNIVFEGNLNLSNLLNFSINNYISLLKHFNIFDYMYNSLIVISLSTILTVYISSLCAFGIRRMEPKIQFIFMIIISTSIIIPFQLISRSLMELIVYLGLKDNIIGLVFANLVYCLPASTLIFYKFFKGIPKTIIESAVLDGLSDYNIYSKIEFPLSRGAVVVSSLYCMIISSNEILMSKSLNQDVSVFTIGHAAVNFVLENNINTVEILAAFALIFVFAALFVMLIKFLVTANGKGLGNLE